MLHPILCLLSFVTSVVPAPRAADLPPAVQQELQAYLTSLETDLGVVGHAVAVLKNGKIVYTDARGLAVKEWRVPAGTDTVFSLFSISKLFTIQTVMGLVEAGKLDLQAPIGTLLPDLPADWQGVTVLQLMNHVSGLPEYYGGPPSPPDADAALALAASKPMAFATGSQNRYNQTNYLLLKRIIEKLSGADYTAQIERFFAEQQMAHTRVGDLYTVIDGRADVYEPGNDGLKRISHVDQPPYMVTATLINSNIDDLAGWLAKFLSGAYLKPKTLTAMWQPDRLSGGGIGSFAHGWERADDGRVVSVGHGGGGRNDVRHFMPADGGDTYSVVFLSTGGTTSYNPRDISTQIADIASGHTLFPLLQLSSRMYDRIAAHDWPGALKLYRDTPRAGNAGAYETMVNNLGYRVMGRLGPEAALPVFQLNIEEHPQAANPYDSLAEAYLNLGRTAEARTYYRKAQDLAPNDRVADILRKLDAAQP